MTKRSEPLRDSLRAVAKESIWLAVRYRPGPKPSIALFCTRRGGSTWLMEIIGANRGVLPLNQPLEILTPNLTPHQYKRLPKFDLGQIVHPDPDQERELRAYTDDLMAGRIRVNAPHAFWRRDFQFRTDRLLLKIVDAKPLMDWFATNYHPDMAYLVRHPVPQAMSCIRNGWSTTTKAYLRNEWFAEHVIADAKLLAYAHALEETGTDLERFVLNWVVENLYPLRVLADRPDWLALSYEECVTDRDGTLRRVSERLDVGDTDRMQRAALRLSRSSTLSDDDAVSAIKAADREEQVAGWLTRLGADALARASAVLDRFEVTLYAAREPMPNWSGYQTFTR
ncbi:MAG TPA: hypothetical protein VGJ28_04955 [Micromonosporaceae bacterium]